MRWFIVMILASFILTACAATEEDIAERRDISSVTFELKQCQQAPWDKWYADGGANFAQEPTPLELAQLFYGQSYGIRILSLEKIIRNEMVCEACDVCPASHYFVANVSNNDKPVMLAIGWV